MGGLSITVRSWKPGGRLRATANVFESATSQFNLPVNVQMLRCEIAPQLWQCAENSVAPASNLSKP
jgi:hypothetical protein